MKKRKKGRRKWKKRKRFISYLVADIVFFEQLRMKISLMEKTMAQYKVQLRSLAYQGRLHEFSTIWREIKKTYIRENKRTLQVGP
jgi:hypothetical protein